MGSRIEVGGAQFQRNIGGVAAETAGYGGGVALAGIAVDEVFGGSQSREGHLLRRGDLHLGGSRPSPDAVLVAQTDVDDVGAEG